MTDAPEHMPPVAILAGGLATRLGDVTKTIPKALLEVAGRPFAAHQLELLRAAGVTRVVMCVAHLADQIEAALGDGSAFGLEILYSHDPLDGTGGALRGARDLLGERFLVVYGDSYLRADYPAVARAWRESGRAGLMTVYRNDGQYDASNVALGADGAIARYDKAKGVTGLTHIDWGLGGFLASAFDGYGPGKLDLVRVYQDLLARNDLFGYAVTERFYEIGSHAGLEETRRLLATSAKDAR